MLNKTGQSRIGGICDMRGPQEGYELLLMVLSSVRMQVDPLDEADTHVLDVCGQFLADKGLPRKNGPYDGHSPTPVASASQHEVCCWFRGTIPLAIYT